MNRKELVKKLEEKYLTKARYLGAPSLAYEIAIFGVVFRVEKDGRIFNANGAQVCAEELLNVDLYTQCEEDEETDNGTAKQNQIPAGEGMPASGETEKTILLPMEDESPRTLRNFTNMAYSNQELIKKSLGTEKDILTEESVHRINLLPHETPEGFKDAYNGIPQLRGEVLVFDFDAARVILKLNLSPEKVEAAKALFKLMIKTASMRRYVSFRAKTTTNEKYTFRTWLLSLGMNGDEYKATRKELLKNLSGNSAFKNPRKEGGVNE